MTMNATTAATTPAWVRPICRAFPGRPAQLAHVRDFVRRHLPPDWPDDARDDIVLCADEIASNAIKHTLSNRPGGRFVVTVRRAGPTVRVEVADGGPLPHSTPASGYRDDGRGLFLVAAIAVWTGYEITKHGGLAWFEYTCPPT